MASRKLVVEIVGDSRQLDRTFQHSTRNAKKFERSMQVALGGGGIRGLAGRGGPVGIAAGTAGLAFLKTTKAASDLNEEITKTRTIFGAAAQGIEAWSKTTADAIGTSRVEALRATGNFGQMFRTIGLGQADAAQMSTRLVQLGADLASFNNEDPTEMLDRLRSGLAGEAEPLRRFGVLLSEARVKQEAYATGIARAGQKLTEQQKVQARYQLILKDTALAQGDFARTSESLANKQRELKAKLADTSAELGTKLLPAMILVTEEMIRGIDAADRYGNAIGRIAGQIGRLRNIGDIFGGLRGASVQPGRGGKRGQPRPVVGESAADKAAFAALNQAAKAAAKPPPPGAGVELRNQWFDARIFRELNRLQDLSLSKQIARLRELAKEVRARLAVTKDATRRLTLEDMLLDIARQQQDAQEGITAAIKDGNEALKDRAAAIKSAVLQNLQRRQTDILNKRALQDAQEALRIARQIGGPKGIQAALRALQDVRFDMLRARIENAPASLTRGGQFALGGVITINIHGVTDPDKVAAKVAEILQRRGRRTTTQTRGPAAGSTAGAH